MWQSLVPKCSQSKWKKKQTHMQTWIPQSRGWAGGERAYSQREQQEAHATFPVREGRGGAGQGQCSRNRRRQRKCLMWEHRGGIAKETTKKLRTSRLYEKNSFEFFRSNWLHFSHCQINFQGVWAPSNSFQHLLRHQRRSVTWCIKKQATDGMYVFLNIVFFSFLFGPEAL